VEGVDSGSFSFGGENWSFPQKQRYIMRRRSRDIGWLEGSECPCS
jgi:hypothetical protein